MARNVYPIFESNLGIYYGLCTSKKAVDNRLNGLIQYRRERAMARGERIKCTIHYYDIDDGDRYAMARISVAGNDGSVAEERFSVYVSKI